MNIPRLALILSLSTAAIWTAKAGAIAAAGGLGRSPIEGPLFLIGLVGAVVAAAVTGVSLARRRGVVVRVLGALAAVVVGSLLGTLAQLVVTAVQPAQPGWAWGEINLWVVAFALVGVNVAATVRRRQPVRPDLPVGVGRLARTGARSRHPEPRT